MVVTSSFLGPMTFPVMRYLCASYAATLCANMVGTRKCFAYDQRRNINTKSTTNYFIYNDFLPVRRARATVAQSLWSYQSISNWTEVPFNKMESIFTIACVTKNKRQDIPGT